MKLLLLVVGIITLVLPTGNAFAQSTTPSVVPHQVIQHKQEVEKKHQEIKEHLKQVPNKHHAKVTEKIHKNLNVVNEKLTNSWFRQITHMSEILNKLEDHLNKLSEEGKDVTQAKAALNNARTKVTTAENALKTQGLKVYTINITNTGHIGPDVKTARNVLHTDLKNVHQIVKDAHGAVIEVIKLSKTIGGNNGQ